MNLFFSLQSKAQFFWKNSWNRQRQRVDVEENLINLFMCQKKSRMRNYYRLPNQKWLLSLKQVDCFSYTRNFRNHLQWRCSAYFHSNEIHFCDGKCKYTPSAADRIFTSKLRSYRMYSTWPGSNHDQYNTKRKQWALPMAITIVWLGIDAICISVSVRASAFCGRQNFHWFNRFLSLAYLHLSKQTPSALQPAQHKCISLNKFVTFLSRLLHLIE